MPDQRTGVGGQGVVGSVPGKIGDEPLPDEEEEQARNQGSFEAHPQKGEEPPVGEEGEGAGREVLEQIGSSETSALRGSQAEHHIGENHARDGESQDGHHVGEEFAQKDGNPRHRAGEEVRERLRIHRVRNQSRAEEQGYQGQEIPNEKEGHDHAVQFEAGERESTRRIHSQKQAESHGQREEQEDPETAGPWKHALDGDRENIARPRPERADEKRGGLAGHLLTR